MLSYLNHVFVKNMKIFINLFSTANTKLRAPMMKLFKKYIFSNMLCWHGFLFIFLSLLFVALTNGEEKSGNRLETVNEILNAQRVKRAPDGEDGSEKSMENDEAGQDEEEGSGSSTEPIPEEEKKSEVSLSAILGICLLICTIIYCIGIGYKIFKICKGTYVEEEPVFLKYK